MAKKPELHFDYDEIKFEAHQRAFTVAKVTQIDLLAEIQASLENAFVEGQSFESWRKNLKPTLQKHGWLGQTSVINPKTGEEKEIFVGAKRLKTIFYTNARTAYAQAEARAGYELKLSEYIRYVAILDNRVRAEHAALHGKIAHRKDKFWETNYPPNGWNCRCSVEFISKDEMDELGWVEMSDIEKSLNYAEKGWDKDTRGLENPTLYLQELIKDKLKLYESKHLSGAVKALNAVKDELAENEARYQSVKALFDEAKTLTPKEAKGEAGRKFVVISKANDEIKKALNTDTDDIRLSAWTIFSHLKREKITAFDYSIVRFMDKSYKTHKGNKGESIVDYYYLGIYYRAVFKKTTKNEIYLDSLVASDREI